MISALNSSESRFTQHKIQTGQVNSQEGIEMTLTKLQLTQFKVQKLQCIGGEGRAAPYRITTFRGMELGSFGIIGEAGLAAANAPSSKALHQGLIPALKRLLGRTG